MRQISFFGKRLDDLLFVVAAEGFQSDGQLHGGVAVRVHKLVMLELDHISLFARDHAGHAHQGTGLVRKQDRDREDPVSRDQAVLDAVQAYRDMITNGVLAVALTFDAAPADAFAGEKDINGKKAVLSVKKA